MKQALIGVLAQIEAVIDFPDEESLVIRRGDLTNCINERIITPISDLITAFSQRKLWHEGVSVAIVGRVNVGKSSILNRLLRKEKAIVTPIPGTTRDILDMLTINGLPLKLIDTAGIRKVKGMVEKKGVDLTKTQLSLAHLILLVIDQSRPLNRYDLELIREVDKDNTIVIFNKIDLPARVQKVKITTCFKDLPGVKVSALTGDGFDALIKTIFDKVTGKQPGISSAVFLPNLRHNILLEKAARFLESATQNLVDGLPLELVATDLSWVKDTLDEITGYKINEEVLDKIFSDFCLGK